MPRPKKAETWYAEAIELMLRERLSLLKAASYLGVELLPEEAAAHQRRRTFHEQYDQMAHSYYTSKSGMSQHTKGALVGMMLDVVERLLAAERFSDAAEALFKLAKVEGWVGPESSVNIFQELSGKDIVEMRDALRRKSANAEPKN